MYDELIANLRNCAELNSLSRYKRDLMKQAADAIEGLEEKWQTYAETLYAYEHPWIPVTERLPKGGDDSGQLCENVLLQMSVEYNDNYVTSGWINGVTKKVYYLDEKDDFIHKADMSVVKAWMPLPDPPKEEKR